MVSRAIAITFPGFRMSDMTRYPGENLIAGKVGGDVH